MEKLKPIRYRVYLLPERSRPYHESIMDHKTVYADRFPIPKIFDLEFEEIQEGKVSSNTGKIKFEYCCVTEREVTVEEELIVNLYGQLC